MSNRISPKDVEGMFTRCANSAQAVGLDTTGWCYTSGSSTNGQSYKLDAPTLPLSGWGGNYLGSTAREAYDALHFLAMAFEAVERAK